MGEEVKDSQRAEPSGRAGDSEHAKVFYGKGAPITSCVSDVPSPCLTFDLLADRPFKTGRRKAVREGQGAPEGRPLSIFSDLGAGLPSWTCHRVSERCHQVNPECHRIFRRVPSGFAGGAIEFRGTTKPVPSSFPRWPSLSPCYSMANNNQHVGQDTHFVRTKCQVGCPAGAAGQTRQDRRRQRRQAGSLPPPAGPVLRRTRYGSAHANVQI